MGDKDGEKKYGIKERRSLEAKVENGGAIVAYGK